MYSYRYSIALSLNHVPAFLPYISDTGVRVPERSVFSQFVNLAAFFHMVTIYVRYEQVRAEIKYRWNEEHFRGREKSNLQVFPLPPLTNFQARRNFRVSQKV